MKTIFNILVLIIYSLSCLFIIGCSQNQAPLEFSPKPIIIKKAIKLELNQKYERISKQLHTQIPKFKVTKINVMQIQTSIKFQKPTYHLEGQYKVILQQSRSKKKKITSNFQIDLQRQSAGKTWQIIIPDKYHNPHSFFIYKIY